MSLLEAALAYAARSWPVFPLEPRGKMPIGRLVPHGLKDASTDEALIRAWWTGEPEANIGIPTGIAFDVADLDSEEAVRRFLSLAGEHGTDVHSFPRSKTGKGRHVLVAPTGYGNRGKNLLPETHWRGRGGYIVAPPSVHPDGPVYEWLHEPNGGPLPECPQWLRELLQPPSGAPEHRPGGPGSSPIAGPPAGPGTGLPSEAYVRAAIEEELTILRSAREGQRNNTLNDAAFALGQMVGAGWLSVWAAENDLRTAAEATGLSGVEVTATIRSGLTAGQLEPREAPPVLEHGKAGGVIVSGRQRQEPTNQTPSEISIEGFDALVESGPEWASKAGQKVPVIVRGFLGASGLGMMISDPKAGKTWLVLEIVICTITGLPLFDKYPVEQSGKVLYVATEGSREGTLARLKALSMGKGLEVEKVLNGIDFLWRRGVRLDDPAFIRWLTERGADYNLIVVDVLAEAWAGNESKPIEVSELIRGIRPITDMGATVLLLHHLSKRGAEDVRTIWERLRGSSAWTGAYDSGIGLERATSEKRTKVSFQHRDDAPLEPFTFTWPDEFVDGSEPITLDWRPVEGSEDLAALQLAQQRVIEKLRETPGLSQKELTDQISGRSQNIRSAVKSLKEAGHLVERTVSFTRRDGREIQKPALFVAGPNSGTTGTTMDPPGVGGGRVEGWVAPTPIGRSPWGGGGATHTPGHHPAPPPGDDPPTRLDELRQRLEDNVAKREGEQLETEL